jgi:hypothetical protein
MTFQEIGQLIALGCAVLGTGSWIGWTIRTQEKRLRDVEKDLPNKMDAKAHDDKRDKIVQPLNDRIAALEAVMPKDLQKRLRGVEESKLSTKSHAQICSTAMRTVEVQVAGIKEILNKQEDRLKKGNELFIKLSRLAGRMEEHLNRQGLKT